MRIFKVLVIFGLCFLFACGGGGSSDNQSSSGGNGDDSGGDSSTIPYVAGTYTSNWTITASTCPEYTVGMTSTDSSYVVSQERDSRNVSVSDGFGNQYSGAIAEDGENIAVTGARDTVQYSHSCFAHADISGTLHISTDRLNSASVSFTFSSFTGDDCPVLTSCGVDQTLTLSL